MTIVQSPVQIITSTIVKPVVGGGGGDPGFIDPTSLPDLVFWYDASDTGTITETLGDVEGISDKSGLGNDAEQTTPSLQGRTGDTTLNSLNVLDFDVQGLNVPSGIGIAGSNNRTIMMVAKHNDAGTGPETFWTQGPNSNRQRFTFRTDSDNLRVEIQGQGTTSSISLVRETWAILAVKLDGSNLNGVTVYKDGSSETLSGTNAINTGDTAHAISRNFAGSTYSQTSMAAIAGYARALTNSELNQLGNYWADRYNLTWADL